MEKLEKMENDQFESIYNRPEPGLHIVEFKEFKNWFIYHRFITSAIC